MPALRILELCTSLPGSDIVRAILSYCPSVSQLVIRESPLDDSPQTPVLLTQLLDQPQFHLLFINGVSNEDILRGLSPQQSVKIASNSAPPMCIVSEHDPSAAARAKAFYEHALSTDVIATGATASLFEWVDYYRAGRKPYHVALAISALSDPDVVALMKSQLRGQVLLVHYPALLQHLVSIFVLASGEPQKSVALDLIKHLLGMSKRPLNHLVHCLSFNLDSFDIFLPLLIAGEAQLELNLSETLFHEIHWRWRPRYAGLHWFLQYDSREELSLDEGMHLSEHAAFFQQIHTLEALVHRASSDETLRSKSLFQHYTLCQTLKWIDNIKLSYIDTEEELLAWKSLIKLILKTSKTAGVTIKKRDVFWIGMVAPFFGKMNMCEW